MNITDNGKAIDRMIASIARSTKARQEAIHVAALSAVLHCVVHENSPDKLNNLAKVCGYDQSAVRQWAVKTGLFSWVPKVKDKEAHLKMTGETWKAEKAKLDADRPAYVEALAGLKPYHELIKAKEFDGADLLKTVKATVARFKRYKDNPDQYPADKIKGLDMLPALEKMLVANQLPA